MSNYRRIMELHERGVPWRVIREQLGCSTGTINRALKAHGEAPWLVAEQKAAREALALEIARARQEMRTAPLYKFQKHFLG